MANSHSWNVELVAEKWRIRTYVAFWIIVLFAMQVTKFFAAPRLKAGPPADTPANRMACGPFYFLVSIFHSLDSLKSTNYDKKNHT
jgi:hypothetical protein